MEGKISCSVGRVKEETIKGLFVRVFNRLYTNRIALLGDYKAKLERENFDDGKMAKLDEEVQSLIQQERVLLTIKDMDLRSEHEELASKLTKLQAERAELDTLARQDTRMARTLELEAFIDSPILEFSEDLYSAIIEKVIVKERTILEFHLKNGLVFEEKYTLKRGRDLL